MKQWCALYVFLHSYSDRTIIYIYFFVSAVIGIHLFNSHKYVKEVWRNLHALLWWVTSFIWFVSTFRQEAFKKKCNNKLLWYLGHLLVTDTSKNKANINYPRQTEITLWTHTQGGVSIRKTVLPGMAIPMLKIRRPNGRLIFNMEITIRR